MNAFIAERIAPVLLQIEPKYEEMRLRFLRLRDTRARRGLYPEEFAELEMLRLHLAAVEESACEQDQPVVSAL